MKRLLATFLLMMCLAPSAAMASSTPWHVAPRAHVASSPATGSDSVGVIVRFEQPASAPLEAHLLSAAAGTTAEPTNRRHGLYTFATPPDQTAEQYSLQLMLSAPGVASADPNYVRHIDAYVAPTDPDFNDATAWTDGMGYYLGAKHWWLDAMNAQSCWQIGQGSTYPVRATPADIKVAVLDTGFYLSHQEFNGGTVTAGKDECASYNPGTGVYATDFDVTPDVTTDTVTMSHGTATAAAVGAEVNGVGMVGAGWNPQVVGYKVAGPITADWSGYPAGTVLLLDGAIVNGIYDAVDSGCKVINMSLGAPNASSAFQAAVTYAHDHGVVVCASAGNDGNTTANYPAACTYATGVAAIWRSGGSYTVNGTITRASFSDYAPGVNALCAPGAMFWTADKPDWDADGSGTAAIPGYQFWYGTSFSSPAVAGAIAYVWRAEPDLTGDQIVSYVESSAVDLGATGRDDSYGYGLVDMQAAYNKLVADYPMLAKPTISAATYMRSGQNVSWTTSAGYNVNYAVSVDGALRSTQTSTSYSLPSLSDGQHLISILPTSSRNWNTSSLATKTIVYDGTAPVVSGFAYNDTTLSWSVAEANPYTVQAYVDTATPVAAPSNTLAPLGLHGGTHMLHVDATDAAGNSSGWVAWDFVVAPDAPVVPSVVVTDALSAAVSWAPVPAATSYDYTINGGATQSTSATGFAVSPLGAGVTSVAVRSREGTLSSSWTSATVTDNVVVPGTPVLSAPPTVGVASATVSWPAAPNALSYEYRLNGGSSTPTTALSATITGLLPGANTLSVRSLDNLAQSAWATATVDYATTTYQIVPTAGPGGTISPGTTQTVALGGSATFTVAGNSGYHLVDVLKDGVSIGASSSVTFSAVQADHTISATFAIDTFTIVPSADAGGEISPATTQTVDYGSDSATFTITPVPGHRLVSVSVDGVPQGPIASYKFARVTADHTISASFAANTAAKAINRLSGSTRYATAVAITEDAFPGWSGVKNLVLASGDNNHQPDALTAAGLAGAYDCPLLLVPTNYLDADTRAAISSMPKGVAVHIVGGPTAVSANVGKLIAGISRVKSVDRTYGADRYATGAAVAVKMKAVLGTARMPRKALLANGASASLLLDPLIASTVSNHMHFPVLLLKSDQVPPATRNALVTLKLSTRYVVGSAAAVNESVRLSLGVTSGNRIAGANIQGDATAFATRARVEGWLAGSTVGFAAAVPDAATGGAYMGRKSGPMLLVFSDSLPQTTQDYVANNKSSIVGGFVFGGPTAVSESVRTMLLGLLN